MTQRIALEIAKEMTTMDLPNRHTGPWTLKELNEGRLGVPKHGLKVFSCFCGGGGSSMGYRLAGYDCLGGLEIDAKMMECYRKNLEPKHSFLMPIQDFNKVPDSELPSELFSLDVLDGSPPCSVFSMAGNREKDWNKEKKFREGQAEQRLDDLFMHFIETVRKLKPKVVVAENVKGLLMGNARGYVKEILAGFLGAGYEVQIFLLNASRMGVPQRRERVFFVARRSDLGMGPFRMSFSECEISCRKAFEGLPNAPEEDWKAIAQNPKASRYWKISSPGQQFSQFDPQGNYFTWRKLSGNEPSQTIASSSAHCQLHWSESRRLSVPELVRCQSYPEDYSFREIRGRYVLGMSVPPLMMQRIGLAIAERLSEAAV